MRRARAGVSKKAPARPAATRVRLVELAHARSGDKGDTANVGLIARNPRDYPLLVREVTAARVARHFRGMIAGPVERYELPNLYALNFLLHGALDGGGTISLKTDAQGKVLSTALLRMEIRAGRGGRGGGGGGGPPQRQTADEHSAPGAGKSTRGKTPKKNN